MADCVNRDKFFERTRAALTMIQTERNPQHQAEMEMAAFMSIFHPEVDDGKVRELVREAGDKARSSR